MNNQNKSSVWHDRSRKVWEELGGKDYDLSPERIVRVLQELNQVPSAVPSEAMTRELIESLRLHVPVPRFRDKMEAETTFITNKMLNVIRAIKPQATLMGRAFWFASILVMALITVLIGILTTDGGGILVLAAPFLAVAGVSFAFRGTHTGFWEVEQTCPVDPISLAVARFAVVILYDAILVSLITMIMAGLSINFQIGSVFLSWLAPFLFLGTVTLLVAIKWNGNIAGAVGMGFWVVLVWGHIQPFYYDLLALPGTEFWLTGKLVLLLLTIIGWLLSVPIMSHTFSSPNLSGGE